MYKDVSVSLYIHNCLRKPTIRTLDTKSYRIRGLEDSED